jgi:hypothetical protein
VVVTTFVPRRLMLPPKRFESKNDILCFLPPCSPELNPQENIRDMKSAKIFKNYALKSMDGVCHKLEEAALYIERNPKMVKSITSFPYVVGSM